MMGSMKRVAFSVLFGLVALACAKDAPSPQLLPPWQWAVTGMKPGSVALPPTLVVCEANGSNCTPAKAGLKLTGSKLVRLERGVSEHTYVAAAIDDDVPLAYGMVRVAFRDPLMLCQQVGQQTRAVELLAGLTNPEITCR